MIRPLKVVALDLSNKATAIAATHDPHGDPFLGVYTVPGTALLPLHAQIDLIEAKVRRACGRGSDRKAWQPDLVVIEGTFSRAGAHTSDYPLHALHSQVKQWLYRREIPYVDVSPATLKVWATGSGSARGASKVTKDDVVRAVMATYGGKMLIDPNDNNQTDAVALLTMALAHYGQPLAEVPSLPGRPNSHRRALSDLPWPAIDWSRS